MNKELLTISHHACTIYKNGTGGKIIYWGVSAENNEHTQKVADRLKKLTGKTPWTLVCFEVSKWNNDLSPWQAPSSDGEMTFGGGGRNTLNWLLEECIPIAEDTRGEYTSRFIGGYSLSGLFSLWTFYESRIFSGAISCSGSLWFEGWEEYMMEKAAPKGSMVYLSLGIKEEKTKNKLMATVGNMTRKQFSILQNDSNVAHCALEWHNGGHFTEPENRIAQGFAWAVKE